MGIATHLTTDGGSNNLITNTAYGTCETAAGTAAKVVVMSNFDTFAEGMHIAVTFEHGNTAASPTLNVNSKGAKPIDPTDANLWVDGATVEFVYNTTNVSGGCWSIVNRDFTAPITDLKEDITNFYLSFDLIDGEYYNTADGSIAEYSAWSRTDYINISGFDMVRIKSDYPVEGCVVFTSDKTKIFAFSVTGTRDLTLPSNAVYIGLSANTTYMETVKIENPRITKMGVDAYKLSESIDNIYDLLKLSEQKYDYNDLVNSYALDDSGLFSGDSSKDTYCYAVEGLEVVHILTNNSAGRSYQFQSAKATPTSGSNPYIVGSSENGYVNKIVNVPTGAKYLYIAMPKNDTTSGAYTGVITDYSLSEFGMIADSKAVGEKFKDVENSVTNENLYATDIHVNDARSYVVGSGQTYTTITDAYNQWIADGKPCAIIKVLAGTYEESLIISALVNNNRLYIIGEDKDTVVWKMIDADYDHPPLACCGNITIKNISFVVAKNTWNSGSSGAYAIHIDDVSGQGSVVLDNVYAESILNSAIGCGTRTNQQIILKNVELEHTAEESWAGSSAVNNGALLYHTSATPSSPNQKINLDNVHAHSKGGPAMQFLSSGNGDTDVDTTFRFCVAHSDFYETYDGGRYKEDRVVFSNANGKMVISEDSMFNNSNKLNYE